VLNPIVWAAGEGGERKTRRRVGYASGVSQLMQGKAQDETH
jgi:hypothetical protein